MCLRRCLRRVQYVSDGVLDSVLDVDPPLPTHGALRSRGPLGVGQAAVGRGGGVVGRSWMGTVEVRVEMRELDCGNIHCVHSGNILLCCSWAWGSPPAVTLSNDLVPKAASLRNRSPQKSYRWPGKIL